VAMLTFPAEVWLIIIGIVIEEGIIRVDQCSHTTFPYIHRSLSSRYRLCETETRLRLVCRGFNTLVNLPSRYHFMGPDVSPIPPATKVLCLDLGPVPVTSLSYPSQCRHLLYLEPVL
jgi:hypothetical protein